MYELPDWIDDPSTWWQLFDTHRDKIYHLFRVLWFGDVGDAVFERTRLQRSGYTFHVWLYDAYLLADERHWAMPEWGIFVLLKDFSDLVYWE